MAPWTATKRHDLQATKKEIRRPVRPRSKGEGWGVAVLLTNFEAVNPAILKDHGLLYQITSGNIIKPDPRTNSCKNG